VFWFVRWKFSRFWIMNRKFQLDDKLRTFPKAALYRNRTTRFCFLHQETFLKKLL
jgi:hypothetical protein